MPRPIINGSLQPQRQSLEITYDPSQGVTTTQEFESAGDNCNGLAAQFQRAGVAYRLHSSPVRSRLVAMQSRNGFISESAVERWELLSNQHMMDLREHPNSISIGRASLSKVNKAVKRHEAGQLTNPNAALWEITDESDGTVAKMLSLFRLLIRGITHYPVSQWVLRYTANVSNTYNLWTNANGGIGTIYTTSQAAASLPPGRLRSTVQSIPTPSLDSEVVWGWLHTSLTETEAAGNRVNISSEYWLAQWPIYIYG